MSAYLIVDTKLENPEAYEEYKIKARPILEKFGGIYLARGGAMEVLEDDLWVPSRLVLVEFPTRGKAMAALQSAEYRAIRHLRHTNAKTTLVVLEGL